MISRLVSGIASVSKGTGTALKLSSLAIVVALSSRTAMIAQTAAQPVSQPAAHGLPSTPKTPESNRADQPSHNFNFLKPPAPETEDFNAKPDDAQHQNVKLHGHWIIDVKNSDGTISDHRDFENSIQVGGQSFLVSLMTGYRVPSDYGVLLQEGSGSGPCTPPTSGIGGCFIVRSLTTEPGVGICGVLVYCSTGLSYSNTISDNSSSSFVLAGSVTANQAGTISSVYTIAGFCQSTASPNADPPTTASNVAPSNCTATPASQATYIEQLSGANLSGAPISVMSGQIIQVTVTISFS